MCYASFSPRCMQSVQSSLTSVRRRGADHLIARFLCPASHGSMALMRATTDESRDDACNRPRQRSGCTKPAAARRARPPSIGCWRYSPGTRCRPPGPCRAGWFGRRRRCRPAPWPGHEIALLGDCAWAGPPSATPANSAANWRSGPPPPRPAGLAISTLVLARRNASTGTATWRSARHYRHRHAARVGPDERPHAAGHLTIWLVEFSRVHESCRATAAGCPAEAEAARPAWRWIGRPCRTWLVALALDVPRLAPAATRPSACWTPC